METDRSRMVRPADSYTTESVSRLGPSLHVMVTYSKLLVLLGNTGTLVDNVHVVGQNGVTRVLGDDTERNDDGESPAVALGEQEVDITGLLLDCLVGVDGLLDLAVLELDGGIVDIAAGVVLGKNGKGLLGLVLADQVTGGLRDEPDTAELDEGRNGLDEGDGSPRPVAVDGGGTPTNDGNDYYAC